MILLYYCYKYLKMEFYQSGSFVVTSLSRHAIWWEIGQNRGVEQCDVLGSI